MVLRTTPGTSADEHPTTAIAKVPATPASVTTALAPSTILTTQKSVLATLQGQGTADAKVAELRDQRNALSAVIKDMPVQSGVIAVIHYMEGLYNTPDGINILSQLWQQDLLDHTNPVILIGLLYANSKNSINPTFKNQLIERLVGQHSTFTSADLSKLLDETYELDTSIYLGLVRQLIIQLQKESPIELNRETLDDKADDFEEDGARITDEQITMIYKSAIQLGPEFVFENMSEELIDILENLRRQDPVGYISIMDDIIDSCMHNEDVTNPDNAWTISGARDFLSAIEAFVNKEQKLNLGEARKKFRKDLTLASTANQAPQLTGTTEPTVDHDLSTFYSDDED